MLLRFMSPVIRDRKGKVCMANKKDLRGNVVKMREVAELLSGWADDLEATLEKKTCDRKTAAAAMGDVPVEASPAVVEPEPAPAEAAASAAVTPLSFEEVRGVLAAKSAAGYRTQVLALICSYGVEKLSEVDPVHYADLMEAVASLGGDGDAG